MPTLKTLHLYKETNYHDLKKIQKEKKLVVYARRKEMKDKSH